MAPLLETRKTVEVLLVRHTNKAGCPGQQQATCFLRPKFSGRRGLPYPRPPLC